MSADDTNPEATPTPRGSWAEDPRFSLDMLSPGQRYTAVIAGALAVAMLTVGLPGGGPVSAVVEDFAPTEAAVQAGLTQRPAAAPVLSSSSTPAADTAPTAAPSFDAAPSTFDSAPIDTSSTNISPSFEPAPEPTPTTPSPSPEPSSSEPDAPAPAPAPAPVPAPALPAPVPEVST